MKALLLLFAVLMACVSAISPLTAGFRPRDPEEVMENPTFKNILETGVHQFIEEALANRTISTPNLRVGQVKDFAVQVVNGLNARVQVDLKDPIGHDINVNMMIHTPPGNQNSTLVSYSIH